MLVFAIETSCDETSVCIMDHNKNIYSHIISSQEIHKKFGGVVPELASRAHLELLQKLSKKSIEESGINISEIDIFAATCGPGLIGPLLIGSTYAKSLSIGTNKPFIPINHIEGHIFSTTFNNSVSYPHISILLTGGHTQIYFLKSEKEIFLLSESVDDAVGETFDKVAKILGLNYPGGPEIEKWALVGNKKSYNFPKPTLKNKSLNMSFSGIKTAINILVKKNKINDRFVSDVCASFQNCITQILIEKLNKTFSFLENKSVNVNSISVVGGVSNNKFIRDELKDYLKVKNIKIFFPIEEMMSDNAAMIAWLALRKKKDIYFKPNPRLEIIQNDSIFI